MNSNVDHDGNGGRTGWNGRYYVTLVFPHGTVRRQSARLPVPSHCQIAACDNGMQDRDYYRKMLADLRAKAKGGERCSR